MHAIDENTFQLRSWTHGFELEVLPGAVFCDRDERHIAHVRVSGRYRTRGVGEAYRPILMAVHAALAWPSNRPPAGLILDISGMHYVSGSALLAWRFDPRVAETVGARLALICSSQNRPFVESLLVDEDDHAFLQQCHSDMASAIGALLRAPAG